MLPGNAKSLIIIPLLLLVFAGSVFSQNTPPVKISFDKDSPRIDIVTGQKLPNYTQAQRGSIQFFYGRLDTPENGFWYFFDGRRFQPADRTLFIRKLKASRTWIIAGASRWGEADQTKGATVPTAHPNTNCEIEHHAVSFIPLSPSAGAPEARVFVRLEDLELIQWHPYNHWLATESQEKIETKKGVVY
ncbi:MAG: hypothetical protein ACYC9O_11985 [Candidatus Latescibacterota bacterium]